MFKRELDRILLKSYVPRKGKIDRSYQKNVSINKFDNYRTAMEDLLDRTAEHQKTVNVVHKCNRGTCKAKASTFYMGPPSRQTNYKDYETS